MVECGCPEALTPRQAHPEREGSAQRPDLNMSSVRSFLYTLVKRGRASWQRLKLAVGGQSKAEDGKISCDICGRKQAGALFWDVCINCPSGYVSPPWPNRWYCPRCSEGFELRIRWFDCHSLCPHCKRELQTEEPSFPPWWHPRG